ncbi:MAG: succinate--CoA ligase subunit beta [candidate division Zixibacteria bacterium]|nr:succinate--CoA ligase subunit beta [candidate division Zixibacteria bacterium]
MRLYEYEAKELFSKFSIPTPGGKIASDPGEALDIAEEFDYNVVLKSQVLSGGRGKAGGIKFAHTQDEVDNFSAYLFNIMVKGYPVDRILVDPLLDIEHEYYLGMTIDRANYKLVMIASSEGGIDIEEVAATSPEKIIKIEFEINDPFFAFDGMGLAKKLGVESSRVREFNSFCANLYKLFNTCDAKLVEINPLVRLKDGSFVAADARMSLDDDALFRHPELAEIGIEKRHEEGELTPREKQAREWGIPYLDLDGNIGMFPGGAGFGIMGNDFIHYYGGKPANFMDSGGGPSPERIAKMLILLDENPNVKTIFGARFGGISRCDDFAKGVMIFLNEHGLSKPIVMRMTGNMWQEGVRIFEEGKAENPELFKNIEFHGIETPIEDISKRAVELAKERKNA